LKTVVIIALVGIGGYLLYSTISNWSSGFSTGSNYSSGSVSSDPVTAIGEVTDTFIDEIQNVVESFFDYFTPSTP
jgi:hypothetical protein